MITLLCHYSLLGWEREASVLSTFWNTGQFKLRVRYMFQHWYTIKANDNRESLLFAFFLFCFFVYYPFDISFIFLPQRKYKTNGKIRIWGFPEAGFFSEESRRSVCPAVMWESVLKCDCMCQRKRKKTKKNRVFACVWACVCVRAC